jgi:hypothetical protein
MPNLQGGKPGASRYDIRVLVLSDNQRVRQFTFPP